MVYHVLIENIIKTKNYLKGQAKLKQQILFVQIFRP